MVVEVMGDILKTEHSALAHCITADYSLGAGLALAVDEKYEIKDELNQIGKHIYPDCIKIVRPNKIIYNLVDKEDRWNDPTIEDLEVCLMQLKEKIIEDKIESISIPKIGCGRDHLEWSAVKPLIEKIFKDVDTVIFVCYII